MKEDLDFDIDSKKTYKNLKLEAILEKGEYMIKIAQKKLFISEIIKAIDLPKICFSFGFHTEILNLDVKENLKKDEDEENKEKTVTWHWCVPCGCWQGHSTEQHVANYDQKKKEEEAEEEVEELESIVAEVASGSS